MLDSLPIGLERLDALYSFSAFVLIAGLFVTVVSGGSLLWINGLRNRAFDYRIAGEVVKGDQAKLEAARANERAAAILLQARQQAVEHDKLRIELERTKLLTADRRLTPDQIGRISASLAGQRLSVTVLSAVNDREAAQFAQDLVKALKDAGVTVVSQTSIVPLPIQGIGVSASEGFAPIFHALRGVGLDVQDLPAHDPVMIAIGARPKS